MDNTANTEQIIDISSNGGQGMSSTNAQVKELIHETVNDHQPVISNRGGAL
jgi:hypothetical protein